MALAFASFLWSSATKFSVSVKIKLQKCLRISVEPNARIIYTIQFQLMESKTNYLRVYEKMCHAIYDFWKRFFLFVFLFKWLYFRFSEKVNLLYIVLFHPHEAMPHTQMQESKPLFFRAIKWPLIASPSVAVFNYKWQSPFYGCVTNKRQQKHKIKEKATFRKSTNGMTFSTLIARN